MCVCVCVCIHIHITCNYSNSYTIICLGSTTVPIIPQASNTPGAGGDVTVPSAPSSTAPLLNTSKFIL